MLTAVSWIFTKIFLLIKYLLLLLLIIVLCGITFVNGFLSEVVKDLPLIENLGVPDAAMTSKIYAADGTLLGDVHGVENRVLIGWHQLPTDLRDAIVATEDKDFYEHPGIDLRGIARAARENLLSGNPTGQGGSTLTQQLVTNLYLSRGSSIQEKFQRKIAEIILAIKIEQKYSKDEILTFYLNQVYFGSNAYGVEAAAQTYFGKSVSECDLAECALLAGLPKAPARLSPYVSLDAATERRTHVLERMLDEGYITQDEFNQANSEEIVLTGRRDVGFSGLLHPYFTTYVINEVQEQFGLRSLYTDGLRIYTTVNLEWQQKAEEVLAQKIEEFSGLNVSQGAIVTLDVKTGAVLAMVGGLNFDESEFNRAWQAYRQPGSSFKPYVYLQAMRQGYSPNSLIRDEAVEYQVAGSPTYRPHNYDNSFKGIITLRTALALSRNIPAVRIVDIVGAQRIADLANTCGIESEIYPALSMGIGTSEVTLLNHTSSFATFANDGIRNQPYSIERITDVRGNVLYTHSGSPQRVVEENPVRLLVSMMETVVTSGTATRTRITGHHIAGKTGTTDDWRDAWFLGFTPSVVTGVWVGNDDNSEMARVTGGRYPGEIWHDYMVTVLEDYPDETFPPPSYPRVNMAMDHDDSQALLEAEKELKDLAEELGLDPEEYTLEQLRAAQARGDVFGNLKPRDEDDPRQWNDPDAYEGGGDQAGGSDDEETSGDEGDSGGDEGGDDEEEDDGGDDEPFVFF